MTVFDDEEIQQIIQDFYQTMAHRQYIGARYVPTFGRKDETSVEWDNSAPYEALTIVTYQGDSFTSRQYVPSGIAIENKLYWAHTGIFNAQIEAYRNDVRNAQDALADEQGARIAADETLQSNIDGEAQARELADTGLQADIADETANRIEAVNLERSQRMANDASLSDRIDANYNEIKANDIGNLLEGYSLFSADLLVPSTAATMSDINPMRLDMFTGKQVGIRGSINIHDDIDADTPLFYFQVPVNNNVVRWYYNVGTLVRNGVSGLVQLFVCKVADSYTTPDGIAMMTFYCHTALHDGDLIYTLPYMVSGLGMGNLRPWNETLFTEAVARTAAYHMEQFSGLSYSNDFYLRTRIIPTYDADAGREYVKSNESDCTGTIWGAYYLALQNHDIPAVLSNYSVSLAAGGNHLRAWNQGEDWTADEIKALVKPGDILTLSKQGEPGHWDHCMMFLDDERICHSTTNDYNGNPMPSGSNPVIWTIDDFVNKTYLNPRTRMRVITRLWS